MTAEAELATRARAGNRFALAELVYRFDGPVFAVCYRFLGNAEEARDAAQETHRRVLQKFATFDPARPFGPWILEIARNVSRDRLSERGREPASLAAIPEPVSMPPPAAPDVEQLRNLLPRLESLERSILEMRLEHEMTHEEIASALQLPPGTVRSHASRAIAKLRRWMGVRS